MQFRDRIKELRRIPASQLLANPANWRSHPAAQSAAMKAVLENVGFAGAALAYETEDGLVLIDGHLRQELSGDQVVPVLVLDVDEQEANLLLATFDPLSQMAETDSQKLADLLEATHSDDAILSDMLARMGQEAADKLLADAQADDPAQEIVNTNQAGSTESDAPAADYGTFTTPITLGQEQTIRQAIRSAKQKHGLERTGDALAIIAQEWLDANGG